MKQKLLIALFFVLAALCLFTYISPEKNWNAKQIELLQQQEQKEDFCFAVTSDIHNNLPAFNRFLESLHPETKFIVVNGDFVHYGFNEEYLLAIHMFKKLEIPIFVNIGNHEIQYGGRETFKHIFGKTYYSFNFSNTNFIFLDNSFESIDVEQYEWLEPELNKNFENNIVFIHIPPINPLDRERNTADSEILESAFKQGAVSIVFSGHLHKYYDFETNGLLYIIGGSNGGSTFDEEQEDEFSYTRVCVSGTEITTEKIVYAKQTHTEQIININGIVFLAMAYKITLISLLIYFVIKYLFKVDTKTVFEKKIKKSKK